jgi:DNA-binding transcriptional LysR family regulator
LTNRKEKSNIKIVMTLEQLNIFIAVGEREHLTRAAEALGLTPSAVSASIKALERQYKVRLFDRVGRGIQLTRIGQSFLREAIETVARARAAEALLTELGELKTGRLDIYASQTIANYWLPAKLLRFAEKYPGVQTNLTVRNTLTVSEAVLNGAAELGFIEGTIEEKALNETPLTTDKLVIVTAPNSLSSMKNVTLAAALTEFKWVLREPGSGTRAVFEQALQTMSINPGLLNIVLVLPSNEAVLSAVRNGNCFTAISETVVAPFVETGQLTVLDISLPLRQFTVLTHKQRFLSSAARAFKAMCETTSVRKKQP